MNAESPGPETLPAQGGKGAEKDSSTAEMCALIRSVESRRPEKGRILDDPFAHHFIQDRKYRLMFSWRMFAMSAARAYDALFSGWAAEIILRYRHSDELIRRAVESGCTQVVILGAGYDSTALRSPGGAGTVYYEVDKPDIQRKKQEIIQQNSLPIGPSVKYVSCDFEAGDDLLTSLVERGFDPAKPSFVSWLGVTYYLTEASVRATLQKLDTACAPGSRIVFDYILPSVVEGTIGHSGALRGTKFAAKRGEPFAFGVEGSRLDHILPENGGLRMAQNHTVPQLLEMYGDPKDFWLAVSDFIGVVELERT
ncbi:hypothetical protein DB35_25880 [Streptomyces abyssalis]|uniref:S-adenosyl-L-methionine-dependent methyltransferase n=1 Tax=Streptomyces abyssalis TaxID=933944 RepID=A0A1E7JMZ6_9ACTN|nr:class I SAM-dependent methyltransferase [Streptomyces abyssalis]OEU87001.1 hypothetical protein DB35_25880 [Streptomyces abyssalis]OEU89614.1 hypothetical protein AN215_07685 [Streptomyces abyssalis]OEV08182.1 hypothetical protein AN219_31070 [Streptomyces nanshensis]